MIWFLIVASLVIGIFWVRFKVWRITIAPFYFLANEVNKLCNSKPTFPVFKKNYYEPVTTTLSGAQIVLWPLWLCLSVYMAGLGLLVYVLALLFHVVGHLLRLFGIIRISTEQQKLV